jgi:hypothetical protein
LIRQKELTSLTGQSADALKKAEEERRKDLAYQLKVSRMSPIAQENIKEGFAIAQSKFGDEAAQYLKEYVRTQGKITDPAMISFAAGNQEVARTMQMFAENVNLSTTDFRRTYAGFIKENAGAYRGFAESIEDLAELPPSLMNNFVQTQTKMGASLIANQGFFEDLPTTVERMIREGTKLRDVLVDPATKAFVDAERERARIQREIDGNVLTNMQNIGSTITYLNQITLSMVKSQKSITELLEDLKKVPQTAADFNKSVGNIVDDIFRRMQIPISNSPQGGSTLPQSGQSTPVSIVPGQSPIPVAIVSNTSTASPSSPAVPTSTVLSQASVVIAMADTKLASESSKDDSRNLSAEVSRLQTQLASVTNNNTTATQLVTALTDQNSLMKGLNDKMDRMVDSNGKIFEALA